MNIRPEHQIDFYKSGHISQYPKGTEKIYSNFTPRSGSYFLQEGVEGVLFFGLQGFMQSTLIDLWKDNFFRKPIENILDRYKARMDKALGPGLVGTDHIKALWELGYLPLEIKALPEGSMVPFKVPVFTVTNTDPHFAWLVTYLETLFSVELWKPITSATTALGYKKLVDKYSALTGGHPGFKGWQCHDFSMRGMSSMQDAAKSGAAHLTCFSGTDTVPSLDYLEDYYNGLDTFLGGSVPATEHSVMCMGSKETEIETFRRLISEVYPTGIVSIVSDTWDFWKVITEYLPELKEEILARPANGIGQSKTVLRPDSGDPVEIICGVKIIDAVGNTMNEALRYLDKIQLETGVNPMWSDGLTYFHWKGNLYRVNLYDDINPVNLEITTLTPELKGAVECLWEIFGGVVTDTGYKMLDSHIGLIYGDSITLARAEEIFRRLEEKGFCSDNVVFGIGSYTYNYVTRDSLGFAMKATHGVIQGQSVELVKDPATDSGTKKSAKGLLRVEKENGKYVLYDQQTPEQEKTGCLETVFKDGEITKFQTITEIRERVNNL
jgi:nicotinamide phosphoribosyltransferase